MKNKILYFVLLLISCQKEVVIEVPKVKPKLVMESYLRTFSFLTNNKMFFKLQQTTGINEEIGLKTVTDANVLLFKNSIFMDTLKLDTSQLFYNYSFTIANSPKEGEEYEIKVFHSNFLETSARTVIPEYIPLIDTTIYPQYSVNEDNFVKAKVDLTFQDPIGENYYEIILTNLSERSNYSISSTFSSITSESYYPSIINSLNQNLPQSLLFSDKKFEGQEITVDVIFRSVNFPISFPSVSFHKIILKHITKEYFEYKTSLLEHIKAKQADILYGLSEPLNVKSYVKNGYGVFSGYNETIVNFELKYNP